MSSQPKMLPEDLTREELTAIVNRIREAVWPYGSDPSANPQQLNADATNEIVSALDDYGLRPTGPTD